MNAIITAWNYPRLHPSDLAFEQTVPLEFNGERNRRLGSTAPIHILFLEGLNLLSAGYRERLVALGYVLHDAEISYRRHEASYPSLLRFSDYERKCFLRWLVIEDIFGTAPFAHFDGDIIFNSKPEAIWEAFSGITFILQGCPAFTLVHEASWLATYRKHLQEFSTKIDDYSSAAWIKRPALAEILSGSNNNLWERKTLSHDQDLLQFLTLDQRLPQADAAALDARNPFALFQNPLTIARDLGGTFPVTYHRDSSGLDVIGDRTVAFWHLQSDFSNYLGYATFHRMICLTGRIELSPAKSEMSYRLYRVLRKRFNVFNRLALCRRYFNDQSEGLGFLLNAEQWHQPGVFT